MQSKVILVNNTQSDIRPFDAAFINCVQTNSPIPEELADLFTLDIIEVDGEKRGIVGAF